MSSDFNINREQAELAGACVTSSFLDDKEYGMTFPSYPYNRDVGLTDDYKEILLSCSGEFRNWLTQWLKDNNIEYTVCPEE